MITNITIHKFFINEENPCDEWEQNRHEKWNQAVKDLNEALQQVINENTMDIEKINSLSSDIKSVESMMKHLDKISIAAKIPNAGYGASIYDAAPDTIISVKLDADMAKTILEQCKVILIKQFKEAADKL
jgi:hypothetical protein|nr:MAG TPA: hypothetical protein [Caudoviricetes sp.]